MDFEAETQKIELERRRLEVEKMRVEIADASRFIWLRPGYLASLSPLLIAFAGVFAAWVTGYFDTQRTQLATEIAALEDEKSDLLQDVEIAQKTIDLGYLRIRMAVEEAQYALAHFDAYSDEFEDAIRRLLDAKDEMSSEGAVAVDAIVQVSEDRRVVIESSSTSMVDLNTTLAEIAASDWAKDLSADPIMRSKGLLRASDGRFYSVEKERFLSEAEARDALPDWF